MRHKLQTLMMKFTAAGSMDLPRLEGVRDVSFLNPTATGTKTAIITINGVQMQLEPGDPMLSLGGYDDCNRMDVIDISFTGSGTGNLLVFANKVVQ
jgi:hypothetical protein